MSNTNNICSTGNTKDTNTYGNAYKSMTFIQYHKTKERLTNGCAISCEDCLLSRWKNGTRFECNELEEKFPERAVKILYGWSKRKQFTTRKAYCLNVCPNARIKNGVPVVCVKTVGCCFPQRCDTKCITCCGIAHEEDKFVKE